jgi:hypothetical protein
MVRPALATVAIAAVALAGCGGDETQANVAELEDCLEATEVTWTVDGEVDLLAGGAGVGGLQVESDTQEIQIVAERTSDDAEQVVSDYEAFGLGQVEQYGTVVVAANTTMSDDEQGAIEGCIEEQGVR